MTPEQRYVGLAAAQRDALLVLADEILSDAPRAEVLEPATAAAGPVRLPAPGGGSFVVGQVVLTRCSVAVDGVRGDGVRPGRDPEGAIAAAVCDAEAERGGTRGPLVADLVRRTQADGAEAARETARLVAATRLGGVS